MDQLLKPFLSSVMAPLCPSQLCHIQSASALLQPTYHICALRRAGTSPAQRLAVTRQSTPSQAERSCCSQQPTCGIPCGSSGTYHPQGTARQSVLQHMRNGRHGHMKNSENG
jgi:hypothetical protein